MGDERMLNAMSVSGCSDGIVVTGPMATEAGQVGTGLPIPLTFADPGSDAYTAAQATTRATTRMKVIVEDSGVVISLDGGVTDNITLKPNMADEFGVNIPLGTSIKVKRYTSGVAMTDLILEVR